MEEIKLTDLQKDALKEIGNICAGNAATALSQLSNKKVEIEVPDILFLSLEKVPKLVGGDDKLVTGLVIRILGDFPSIILLVFSQEDAKSLASLMSHKYHNYSRRKVITEFERSALKEVGIILANAYIGSLASFINCGMVPSVPELIEDMAGAMLDYILIELSNISQYALLVKSEFRESTMRVTGNFFLIPNPGGLKAFLRAIKYDM